MKLKNMFFSFIVIAHVPVYAEKGCMDNSYYCNSESSYDYKKYEYVNCNCPCDRYAHSFKRGLCEKCLHFRAPKPLRYRSYEKSLSSTQKIKRVTLSRHLNPQYPLTQVFDYYRRYGWH